MVIRSASFLKSSAKLEQCPQPNLPEYAFIGRSNVGKSSLINMLTGTKTLAKVSGTPGKTQLINHYIINGQWYLVDLPGYGYAKVSKSRRKTFSETITKYILGRENLFTLFVLVDCRIDPQPIDLSFINWLGENGVPFSLVFTKTDKVGSAILKANIGKFNHELLTHWEELPQHFLTSSVTRVGRDELLSFIHSINSTSPLD